MDRETQLVYPPGTELQFTLPEYCHLPNLSQAEKDVADLIVAAMDTPHFPEAKESHLTLCNKRLAATFTTTTKAPRGPNRAVRRAAGKTGRKGDR